MTQSRNPRTLYAACADANMTMKEAAARIGCGIGAVAQMAYRHRLVFAEAPEIKRDTVAGFKVARIIVTPETSMAVITLPAMPWEERP